MSNTDSQRLDAMRRQRDGYRNQLRKTEQQTNRHEPTKEETMTSKTFENNNKHDFRTLEVDRIYGGARLTIIDVTRKGFLIADSDAPALALAILEAAGVESPYYNLKDAVENLRQHVEREARHAAEAEAQAKLEAEALDLFNAGDVEGEFQSGPYDSFAQIHDYAKPKWLAVARRAREMRADK